MLNNNKLRKTMKKINSSVQNYIPLISKRKLGKDKLEIRTNQENETCTLNRM